MPFDPWNTDGGYPDDWFVLPSSSAQSTAPLTFGAPPNPFNRLLTNAPPSFPAPYIAPPTFNTQPSPFNSASTNLLSPSHPFSPSWGSPPPLLAPPPFPTGSLFSDALKMLAERSRSAPGGLFGNLAQASGATPIFGGGASDPPANQQPTASVTPANAPSQPASSWRAPSSLTTADPISDPGGNLLLAAFRNYLSYASAGSPAQDQQRTNDASDVVSDTSADSGDPNVILVGGDKQEDPPEKTRPIDPLTGLPEPRLPDSQKPLPTLPTPLGEAPPLAPPGGAAPATGQQAPAQTSPPGFTPLEQLPPGSVGGENAGKRFPPSDSGYPEGTPCAYCGQPTTNESGHPNSLEREHNIPRSQGGNSNPENKLPACRTCNRQKGAWTPREWYRWMLQKLGLGE